MKMKQPRPTLLLALAGTCATSAAVLLGGGGADVVQPVARAMTPERGVAVMTASDRHAAAPDPALPLVARPEPSAAPRDLFAAYSWVPPPPTPDQLAAAAAPPRPQAPPLPVTFGGMLQIDGQPLFLLIEGERTYRVAPGGEVGPFRLESANRRELVFVHVPTGLTVTLPISGAPLALLNN